MATFTIRGPAGEHPTDLAGLLAAGADFWPLAVLRELDDAILHLRFNEEAIGTWLFKSTGDVARVLAAEHLLEAHAGHWFVREIQLYAQRVLKRVDVRRVPRRRRRARQLFAGMLLELVLAADQSFMLDGRFEDDALRPPPSP